MKEVLGNSAQVATFDPKALYDPSLELSGLDDPFTTSEIEIAVTGLSKNKASGPDGIPSEFLQTYWHSLKEEIMHMMRGFWENQLHLNDFNKANIVMLPKGENPTTAKEFRPISIINIIPKLISKVLANRLRLLLPKLISPNQTAFMHGRQISENFLVTREILHHIQFSKKPAVFMKIDFAKAFDSIEWEFLIEVMKARGFPQKWINWIEVLLKTASSRVIITGQMSDFFSHKRGLRQGDPLSPMLFNLVADVFQRMVTAVNELLDRGITRRVKNAIQAFQYADDTAVIASADADSLISLKLIIRLFASFSGLRVNYAKSIFVPINIPQEQMQLVSEIMGCTRSQFPVQYLGMPLTVSKPTKETFLPLIENIEKKLGGWQGKMISRGGRLQLVQSVLSTVPTYHMMCFRIPQWVLNRIDRIRRQFLWGKNQDNVRGISLLNWRETCYPKQYGGLAITNLKVANISLLLRWLWKLYCEPDSLWTIIMMILKRRGPIADGPRVWVKMGSFFWNQINTLTGLFQCCTSWEVGNGDTISYWFDAWHDRLRLADSEPAITQHSISLHQAWPIQSHLRPNDQPCTGITFTNREDRLVWTLEERGAYTARSIYRVICGAGLHKWRYNMIWKCKIPPTVKLFIFFALKGKLLTRDVLRRRGMNFGAHCSVCRNCPTESIAHVLYLCPYAVSVWFHVASLLTYPLMKPAGTVKEIWNASWEMVRIGGSLRIKDWALKFSCVSWHIWKQRNNVVFNNKETDALIIANRCVEEMKIWSMLC